MPIELVINPQLHGSNCKISNLINMLPYARHDMLVMADSDAFVGPDYLASVTAPLLDRDIGLVTCIYRGMPTSGIWSRLGAMYINEWYIPSVLLAWLFGHQGYVSGQTACLRRETLQAIGGLRMLANHLADDYRLGELVRRLGLRIVLSPYVVDGEHHEPTYDSLTRHELRWMRTIRVLRPNSFRFLFVGFSLPLAASRLLCPGGRVVAVGAGVHPVRDHDARAAGIAFRASGTRRPGSGIGSLAPAGTRFVDPAGCGGAPSSPPTSPGAAMSLTSMLTASCAHCPDTAGRPALFVSS